MRNQLLSLLTVALCVTPLALTAQANEQANGWVIGASVGAGASSVPTSPTPVYFDATQLTARVLVQHAIGGGLYGGLALMGTLSSTGSDCTLGPCAPPFRQHAGYVTLNYVPGRAIHQWTPIVSALVGVARLPEQWSATPGTRTPAVNTLTLGGAIDVPLLVRPRTALLVGWEGSVLPNAPGDRIAVNTLVITVRHTLSRSPTR